MSLSIRRSFHVIAQMAALFSKLCAKGECEDVQRSVDEMSTNFNEIFQPITENVFHFQSHLKKSLFHDCKIPNMK
jgi:hypothetical protein